MTVCGILFDYTGILMSGLSMLCLLLFVNISLVSSDMSKRHWSIGVQLGNVSKQ